MRNFDSAKEFYDTVKENYYDNLKEGDNKGQAYARIMDDYLPWKNNSYTEILVPKTVLGEILITYEPLKEVDVVDIDYILQSINKVNLEMLRAELNEEDVLFLLNKIEKVNTSLKEMKEHILDLYKSYKQGNIK